MSDWGIPDWRAVENYGRTGEWDRKRWQWEFYRRRAVVRDYFDTRAQSKYENDLAFFKLCPEPFQGRPPKKPTEPGFQVVVAGEDVDEIGYSSLPNPRISEQPGMAIFPRSGAARVRPVEPPRAGCTIEELLEMFGIELTQKQLFRINYYLSKYPVALKEGEAALIFDYNLPLAPQLKSAKSYLEDGYAKKGLSTQRRAQSEKWLTYLRVLDGRAEGASWSELSTALPDSVQQSPQTARDTFEAANSLRFNF